MCISNSFVFLPVSCELTAENFCKDSAKVYIFAHFYGCVCKKMPP